VEVPSFKKKKEIEELLFRNHIRNSKTGRRAKKRKGDLQKESLIVEPTEEEKGEGPPRMKRTLFLARDLP